MKKRLLVLLCLAFVMLALSACIGIGTGHVHKYGGWEVEKMPTCTELGIESRYCPACKGYEKRDIPCLGHTYADLFCIRCNRSCYGYDLEFELIEIDGGHAYIVVGMGTNTDANLMIPPSIDGIPVVGVKAGAFASAGSLVSVIFPDTVTFIGKGAFKGCENLEEVVMPPSIVRIEENTFRYCGKLKNVTMPGVSYVGDYAFSGCEYLVDIDFGNILYIGHYGFHGCKSIKAVRINRDITYIGHFAFAESGVSNVVFPSDCTLEAVGSYAFYNCVELKDIYLPDIMATLPEGLFMGCSALENVTIPPAVQYIAQKTFMNCSSLNVIHIGSSVTEIGDSAFAGAGLKELTFAEGSTLQTVGNNAFNGCQHLISVTLPDTVVHLGDHSFRGCSSMTYFYVSYNVEYIGSFGFYGCSSLRTVDFPAGCRVTHIGNNAFYGCTKLIRMHLPNQVSHLGYGAFNGCMALSEVKFPETLTILAPQTFYNCNNLTVVVFNGSLEEIQDEAFYGCSSLGQVKLPESLTSIGVGSFGGCSNLDVIVQRNVENVGAGAFDGVSRVECDMETIPDGWADDWTDCESDKIVVDVIATHSDHFKFTLLSDGTYSVSAYDTTLTYMSIPKEFEGIAVTQIASSGFKGCNALKELYIPGSVTSVGANAFENCSALEKITLAEGVASTGNFAFYNCPKLLYVNLPVSLVTIGQQTFDDCTAIEEVRYGGTTDQWCSINFVSTSSNPFAFGNNSTFYVDGKLVTDVVIGVENVRMSAFYGYKHLKSVVFSDAVTTVGFETFRECSALESVVIGKNVSSFATEVFYMCYNLSYVEMRATYLKNFAEDNYNFGDVGNNVEGGMTLYIANNVTFLPQFFMCPNNGEVHGANLTEVIFEENSALTHIGRCAFEDNMTLKTITIPASVEIIDEYAFAGMRAIESIYFEKGSQLKQIKNYAFGWSTFTSIELPEGVTSAGTKAFYSCDYLKSITVPASLTSFGSECFNLTYLVEEVYYNGTVDQWCSIDFVSTSANPFWYENPSKFYIGGELVTDIVINAETVRMSAFYGYEYLKSVVFADTVKTVGFESFQNCSALESVVIGKGVASFGTYAFYNCPMLSRVELHAPSLANFVGSNYVFSYAGTQTDGLTLYVANTVQRIPNYFMSPHGDNTFNHSPKLVKIEFEEGSICTEIAYAAFEDIPYLPEVSIPASVKTIGGYAFERNISLKKVSFEEGSALTSLASRAFYETPVVEEVYFGGTVGQWASLSFGDAMANPLYGGLATLYVGGNKVTAFDGEGAPHISAYAFYNYQLLESIDTGNTATSVGTYAFYNNLAAKAITIGEAVASIGNYAFYGTVNVEEMYFNAAACANCPAGNYIFGLTGRNTEGIPLVIGNKVTYLPNYIFCPINTTTSTVAPYFRTANFEEGSVCTEIRYCAFEYNFYLESAVVPEGVTALGQYAFGDTESLRTLYLPSTLRTIGEYAFQLDSYIEKVYFGGTAEQWATISFASTLATPLRGGFATLYIGGEPIKEANLNVPAISAHAFYLCQTLEKITIGEDVTSIGTNAFAHTYSVKEFNFNAKNCANLAAGSAAFAYMGRADGLPGAAMTVGANVTHIPNYLLYGNDAGTAAPNIISLTFAENSALKTIGAYAFFRAYNIPAVDLPDAVETVGTHAFYGAVSLTSVDLGTSLKAIPNNMFSYCQSIASIAMPGTVTSIGAAAFYGCTALVDINFSENITSIGNEAFYACQTLAKVHLPDTLQTIGTSAFANCNVLSDLVFGENLTTIGTTAFYNCPSLVILELPENLKVIGQSAFDSCVAIDAIIIPDSVTTIGYAAFHMCTGATVIQIGKGVTSMGEYAFAHTYAVEYLYYNAVNGSDYDAQNYGFHRMGWNVEGGMSVVIGKDVVRIPNYLLCPYNNGADTWPSVTSLSFEKGSQCTTIGFAAFEDINGISTLIIPASVTTFENWALCGCTNLQTLIFEDGTRLSYVGAYATAACNSLSMVLYGGTPAQFASVYINNTNDGGAAHNGCFNAATKVFYSADEPAVLDNYYWYWINKDLGQIGIWGASASEEE